MCEYCKGKADHGRGEIKDSALKALVTSKIFKIRVVKDRSKYTRKTKHKAEMFKEE